MAKFSRKKRPTEVVTGRDTRLSYLNVNTPKTPLGGGKPKYSVMLLIKKSDTVTVDKINAGIQAAYEQGEGILRGAGLMKQFMASTFTDLILRVVLAVVLSGQFGYIGIWCAWPIGWSIATTLSILFYRKNFRK